MPDPATPLPNPNENLVSVFETQQEAEALVVRSLLSAAGIDSQFGENENAPDVLPVGGLSIMVRESDADQARQVIEEYRRSPDQELAEEDALDSLSEGVEAIGDPESEK